MRKLSTAFLFAGSAIAVTPALAQERAPFTGPRVEALIGYDNLRDGTDGDTDRRSGLAYGGAVGYDVQAGGMVVGVEGEIIGATTKARSTSLLVPGDRLQLNAKRDLYAGARVGYAVTPLTLVYAKAGYTNARFETRYDNATVATVNNRNQGGYRLGAGAEHSLSPNTYVKAEYRYSDYGSRNFGIDPSRHQLMAGVGLRF